MDTTLALQDHVGSPLADLPAGQNETAAQGSDTDKDGGFDLDRGSHFIHKRLQTASLYLTVYPFP